jgi:rubrerythrin
MPAKVDVSKLTLMDTLDLNSLIEVEAFERYILFARQFGRGLTNDAGSVFQSMADNEKKHGDQLAAAQ